MGLGNLLGLFQDDPTFGVLSNVKSKPLAGAATSLLGDWQANRTAGQSALSDFISKYLAGTQNAEKYTGQETDLMGQFYNGGMASSLAQLNAQREQAVNDAARVATQEAIRRVNLGRIGDTGTGSSYDARMMMGALTPISTQAALDKANQNRADLEYLTNMGINLAGRRTGLEDALAMRGLVPYQVQQGMWGANAQGLKDLVGIDQANTFYGLQRNTTDLDRWINFLNGEQNDLMGMAGTAASVYPMFGGGGGGNPYSAANIGYGTATGTRPSGGSSL